jgi:hypothetical protein
MGVFGGSGRRASGPAQDPFSHRVRNPKIVLTQLRVIRIGYKKNNFIFLYPPFTKMVWKLLSAGDFFEGTGSHPMDDGNYQTFGASRKDGVLDL